MGFVIIAIHLPSHFYNKENDSCGIMVTCTSKRKVVDDMFRKTKPLMIIHTKEHYVLKREIRREFANHQEIEKYNCFDDEYNDFAEFAGYTDSFCNVARSVVSSFHHHAEIVYDCTDCQIIGEVTNMDTEP